MSTAKRVVLFIVALIVLPFVGDVIFGAIAGGQVGMHAEPHEDHAAVARRAGLAGAAAAKKYRPLTIAASILVAALCCFPRKPITFLFAVPGAIAGFVGMQYIIGRIDAGQQATPSPTSSLAAVTPPPAATPQMLSPELTAWYSRLQAERAALQPGDTAAVARFNEHAAEYQRAVQAARAAVK